MPLLLTCDPISTHVKLYLFWENKSLYIYGAKKLNSDIKQSSTLCCYILYEIILVYYKQNMICLAQLFIKTLSQLF